MLAPLSRLALVSALSLCWSLALAREPPDKDKDRDRAPPIHNPYPAHPARMYNFSDSMLEGSLKMGATPGGAKDISHARDRILAGEVPHPNTFTPEGLFSEYDLPLETGRPCKQIICLSAATAPVDLVALPEAKQLAQLGFASNLNPQTWRRQPLSLVAVVDKSGSMSGQPIGMVQASLHQIVKQLVPGDQLGIVLYGDRSHVHLPVTAVTNGTKDGLHRAIDAIQIAGSTAMEAGLKLGYSLAKESAGHFAGVSRVLLFTDERPNVGATDKESFMGMAREASKSGIGLTTVGVGVHFGAELATAISSVRGGNLVFFPNREAMVKKFEKDFDTLVTELAYDMRLSVRPRKGLRIVGLYGLPGDLVKRTPDGGLDLLVETIFLSKEKGGIYLAFAPEEGVLPPAPGPVADATIGYLGKDGKRYADQVTFAPWQGAPLLGLSRGALLVDEFTTLKKATDLHLSKNDQEGAYQLVRGLHQRMLQRAPQLGLEKEIPMVAKLDGTLTRLSGHKGEGPALRAEKRDPISGLPVPR